MTGKRTAATPATNDTKDQRSEPTSHLLAGAFAQQLINSSFTLDAEMVTVLVGKSQDQTRHIVHKDVLCKVLCFKNLLTATTTANDKAGTTRPKPPKKKKQNNDEIDKVDKTIKLSFPDDDPQAFSALVKWLYTNTVPSYLLTEWKQTCQVYLLAYKYSITTLQNTLIDALRSSLLGIFPSPKFISQVWTLTEDAYGCELRKLILDVLKYAMVKEPGRYSGAPPGREEDYRPHMSLLMEDPELGTSLLWRFARTVGARKKLRDPCKEVGCWYHIHGEGEGCGV
jgi:hypothetical protein